MRSPDMRHMTFENGIQMPLVGFGVLQIADAAECERSVRIATRPSSSG